MLYETWLYDGATQNTRPFGASSESESRVRVPAVADLFAIIIAIACFVWHTHWQPATGHGGSGPEIPNPIPSGAVVRACSWLQAMVRGAWLRQGAGCLVRRVVGGRATRPGRRAGGGSYMIYIQQWCGPRQRGVEASESGGRSLLLLRLVA
jgi:hypothetical protein